MVIAMRRALPLRPSKPQNQKNQDTKKPTIGGLPAITMVFSSTGPLLACRDYGSELPYLQKVFASMGFRWPWLRSWNGTARRCGLTAAALTDPGAHPDRRAIEGHAH